MEAGEPCALTSTYVYEYFTYPAKPGYGSGSPGTVTESAGRIFPESESGDFRSPGGGKTGDLMRSSDEMD